MPGVFILYEDSAGERAEFTLHDLVVRCVADSLDREHRDFKDVLRGIPKKGNSNVRRACQQDLPRLARNGDQVWALYDNDRVRRLVNLPADACKTQVVDALRVGCVPVDRLRVVLLIENTESLLRALRELGTLPNREEMFERAIKNKELQSRDQLFKDAAWRTTQEQRVRLQERVPSFGYLVTRLAAVLRD